MMIIKIMMIESINRDYKNIRILIFKIKNYKDNIIHDICNIQSDINHSDDNEI